MDDLGGGIELNSESVEHEEGSGVFEFLAAVVGIAAVERVEGFFVEGIDDL